MDGIDKKRSNKYDNVMSRVQNRSRNSLKSVSHVTRHEIPSSESVGAKPSVSNVGSSVFSELPIVLNDYSPEVPTRRKIITKPRKTIRSLDPATSPHRSVPSIQNIRQPVPNIRARGSAPVVTNRKKENWSDTHYRQCHSSRSHDRLNDIKDEIKAYRETDKQMKLRSRLYRSCGVILDDVGQVAADKGVQVTPPEAVKHDKEADILRRQEWLTAIDREDLLDEKKLNKAKKNFICSAHFDDSVIIATISKRLKSDAFPTKLLPYKSHKNIQPYARDLNITTTNTSTNALPQTSKDLTSNLPKKNKILVSTYSHASSQTNTKAQQHTLQKTKELECEIAKPKVENH